MSEKDEAAELRQRVEKTIDSAFRQGASDLHFECSEDEGWIRFRIDGILHVRERMTRPVYDDLCAQLKTMCGLDPGQRRIPQEGGRHHEIDECDLDLRVSAVPCVHGESITIRILDRRRLDFDLVKSGLSEAQTEILRRWYTRRSGVVLLTGPSGCGKTTVLYSILQELNEEEIKLCSIEEPVECAIKGVNQMQVAQKHGFTFSAALRATMRQDPDVIMVTEIRDSEVASLVVAAALTGHLVLSSIHSSRATDAASRLRDMGVSPFLLRDTLIGVMAQRLVRVICPRCREPAEVTSMAREYLEHPQTPLYHGAGCEYCKHTGYHGRTGIFELFEPSSQWFDLLVRNATVAELRQQARADGLISLWEDGFRKAQAGITTLSEVLRVSGGQAF
jgi:type II secretory ATPase GspE/PulE/Tfp pilus assembly ATPase PilB-like protein